MIVLLPLVLMHGLLLDTGNLNVASWLFIPHITLPFLGWISPDLPCIWSYVATLVLCVTEGAPFSWASGLTKIIHAMRKWNVCNFKYSFLFPQASDSSPALQLSGYIKYTKPTKLTFRSAKRYFFLLKGEVHTQLLGSAFCFLWNPCGDLIPLSVFDVKCSL